MAKDNTTQQEITEKSKPILQFSVLCDGIAQGQGGKPVFIRVFSNFVRTGIIAQFFIVNRWVYGKGTFKQKIVIEDPDLQKTIAEIPDQEFVNYEVVADYGLQHIATQTPIAPAIQGHHKGNSAKHIASLRR